MLCMLAWMTCECAVAQKVVGGDLSLVPSYEKAGDKWFDASGNMINSYYSDGMITFVKEVAGWNAVRVRLLVDPTYDDGGENDYLATCQDIDYVKKLGKRIKDAGMNFLLDIFYSDTWTDVSQQWIPASWGYNYSTTTAVMAAKVKSYTTEVMNELTEYGAAPDYVQIGNEVSYGMLWDTMKGGNKSTHFFNLSSGYDAQSAKIEHFAALLKAAAEGVRASNSPKAKIVLHCERTLNNTQCRNFYSWVEKAGFTDYDIIGLSYYPMWHGKLSDLKATLSALTATFPTKEIQIVETAYYSTNPGSLGPGDTDTSDIWKYTAAGQASFLNDLIVLLNGFEKVTGLYYWQPEECGNGADEGGTNRVKTSWQQRGFWEISWKSGNHALRSAASLMTLKKFLSGGDDPTENDITNQFVNMDFESCVTSGGDITDCPGWTLNFDQEWDTIWPVVVNEWHSGLVSGNCFQSWVGMGQLLFSGTIISQSLNDLPAGEYTVSAVVHTDYNGIVLFANDDTKTVPATSSWGTAYEVSVTTTLTDKGSLTLGLKLPTAPTTTDEINIYADNFKVVSKTTGIQEIPMTHASDNQWYRLDGTRMPGVPLTKGVYINNGRKVIVK